MGRRRAIPRQTLRWAHHLHISIARPPTGTGGSFERSFEVPESVESGKIEASFKKGVLTLTLPKKAEAQKPAKKIEVKAA